MRKGYGHDPNRFEEFARRYKAELKVSERTEVFGHLCALAKRRALTLLAASKRADISEAAVLAGLLRS